MSHKQTLHAQSPQLANYSSAVARAVEWLGDRYLLAHPINTPMRSHPPAARSVPQLGAGG
jgi:hypothetical protein